MGMSPEEQEARIDAARSSVEEFMSSGLEAAIGMHELFTSYVEGGFTEDQALKFLAYLVVLNPSDPDPET